MTEVTFREIESFPEICRVLARTKDGESTEAKAIVSQYMVQSERVYAGEADGEVAVVWGVIRQSLLSDRGYLWLITTDLAEKHKFLLIRYSRRIIDVLLQRYSILHGECLCENRKAQKWMRFLGATFSYPEGRTIPFQIVR